MSERFYISQPITGERVTLDGPEAHHLLHVMRAVSGDRVTLFDNSGSEFEAVVEKPCRSDAELRIIERRDTDRELPFQLVVGVALPKGDRQKWLVEKLTELGATTLVPLVTERSVAQPSGNALQRLRRAVVEAAKQCGRNRLMNIAEPLSWNDWIQSAICKPKSEIGGARRLVAHFDSQPLSQTEWSQRIPTHVAIGPEGGFTDAERAAIRALPQARPVALGPRILRADTAALAAIALWMAAAGDW
ncbi:MAG TPA: RsmE family RNA methyltransferase [Lacipirellulaceae bacterium]|nr:RsmE family RNA methyltransferase [Lacipirellulaceae bacterium]